MAYSIKDPATDAVIRQLAKAKGKPIVEAIREASGGSRCAADG